MLKLWKYTWKKTKANGETDQNSLWEQKLIDIFEVLGLPIEIKTINISKDNNTYITRVKIILGFDAENPKESSHREITAVICSMNFDKYLGVSYNNGSLELFENLIKTKEPLSLFQIFENKQNFNFIQKSKSNTNNYFFCGLV